MQQPAKSNGDSLLVLDFTGRQAGKPLHQIKNLTINLNRIHRGATLPPGAPCLGISNTTLPNGCASHLIARQRLVRRRADHRAPTSITARSDLAGRRSLSVTGPSPSPEDRRDP